MKPPKKDKQKNVSRKANQRTRSEVVRADQPEQQDHTDNVCADTMSVELALHKLQDDMRELYRLINQDLYDVLCACNRQTSCSPPKLEAQEVIQQLQDFILQVSGDVRDPTISTQPIGESALQLSSIIQQIGRQMKHIDDVIHDLRYAPLSHVPKQIFTFDVLASFALSWQYMQNIVFMVCIDPSLSIFNKECHILCDNTAVGIDKLKLSTSLMAGCALTSTCSISVGLCVDSVKNSYEHYNQNVEQYSHTIGMIVSADICVGFNTRSPITLSIFGKIGLCALGSVMAKNQYSGKNLTKEKLSFGIALKYKMPISNNVKLYAGAGISTAVYTSGSN